MNPTIESHLVLWPQSVQGSTIFYQVEFHPTTSAIKAAHPEFQLVFWPMDVPDSDWLIFNFGAKSTEDEDIPIDELSAINWGGYFFISHLDVNQFFSFIEKEETGKFQFRFIITDDIRPLVESHPLRNALLASIN